MVKITTKKQFEILAQQMKKFPNIACGVRVYGEKNYRETTWREISKLLNRHGPPQRTWEEWQRVWIHYKAKLKKKMATNRRNRPMTGGGPSEEVSLSALEETTANVLQMQLTVDPLGHFFGVQPIMENKNDVELQEISNVILQSEQRHSKEKPQTTTATKRKNTAEDKGLTILEEQAGTQSAILETLNKIEKNLYKKNNILKEIRDIKKEKLKVLKDINKIKEKKFNNLIEEKQLNKLIKHQKLEILKRQLEAQLN